MASMPWVGGEKKQEEGKPSGGGDVKAALATLRAAVNTPKGRALLDQLESEVGDGKAAATNKKNFGGKPPKTGAKGNVHSSAPFAKRSQGTATARGGPSA